MHIMMKSTPIDTIHWLNVAISARRDGPGAVIQAVERPAADVRCVGITVGKHWVVGTDGRLTCFDSPDAARWFLAALGVDRIAQEVADDLPDAPPHLARDLYRVRGKGLQKALPRGR